MFIDRATIFVRSGKGGNGCASLRREKYVPKGGPDGGDGGKGGDVVLRGDSSLTTLLPVTLRPHYRAQSGGPGMGKSMHGADGSDLVVAVPLGTLVFDAESGDLLADISGQDEQFVPVHGGRGGLGNEHFKSATNQTPREATPGEPAQDRVLRLELKLLADVGLIGLPNAGKSTLLSVISRARPKVAAYPFTTRYPHLGIAILAEDRRLVIADIPGLIRGAAAGAGLGHEFLRHIERTRLLIHLLDIAPLDDSDPVQNYRIVREELGEYAAGLLEKPEVIVFNKIDLVPAAERSARVAALTQQLVSRDPETRPLVISGATGEGVGEMLEACWNLVGQDQPKSGWRDTGEPGGLKRLAHRADQARRIESGAAVPERVCGRRPLRSANDRH